MELLADLFRVEFARFMSRVRYGAIFPGTKTSAGTHDWLAHSWTPSADLLLFSKEEARREMRIMIIESTHGSFSSSDEVFHSSTSDCER